MKLVIHDVDYAPEDLYSLAPIQLDLIRQIPGSDRPDYWIGRLESSIYWAEGKTSALQRIDYLIVCARWVGTQIGFDFRSLPVGIAFVTDETVLGDSTLDFAKLRYVAIGTASVVA